MTMQTPLLERELDDLYKTVKKGEKLGRPRRWLAYAFKLIAVFSGIAISTGKTGALAQWLGVAVIVVETLDYVFSNHERLMTETEAEHAYDALGRRVKAAYNRDRDSIQRRADRGDPSAEVDLENMMKAAHDQLTTGIDEIKKKLAKKDKDALRKLSLDNERRST